MAETIRLHPDLVGANRDRLMAWARANGLDPNMIPVPSTATIDAGRLTINQFVPNANGRKQIDPNNPDQILTTTITVDLLEPFPTDLIAVERLRDRIEGRREWNDV